GANIDGASVSYRVVRQARFPIWYYGMKRGGYDRFTQEMEILNGTATTDANGAFAISFTAIPDLKIPSKEKPQFDYKVIADVIDITGETHSSETVVAIGYVSINIGINIPESVSKDSVNHFEIDSKNLSGIFEPAQGTITVTSLQQPDRIFRDRLWKRPDLFVMTKEEYYKSFPNDVYDNENDFTTWPKKAVVATQSFNTATSKTFSLPAALSPGKYEWELTSRDKFGEEITVKKYFTVYAAKDKDIPLLQSLWNSALPEKAEAGTTVPFQLGTSEKEIYAIYEVEARNFSDRKVLYWKKGKENVALPITENFKGGVSVNTVVVKHGRVYSFHQTIMVPYTDKELKLEFETFRNKLLPGQNEEWKLKISGSKGEAVAAEMVAALYDASLDAFRPHNWWFDIQPSFYPYSNWDNGNCFGTTNSSLFAPSWSYNGDYFTPSYDRLNWFGFNILPGYAMRDGNANVMFSAAPAMEKNEDRKAKKAGEESVLNDSVAGASLPAKSTDTESEEVAVRKNLQETAFFFSQLQTDEKGNVIIRFTIPEALTRWKFMGFAHTTDLKYGMITKETITQKDLMVTPNAPRFFREGDQIYFSAKVTNLSDHDLTVSATLQLFDALTMKAIDANFGNANNVQSFATAKGQSTALSWSLTIPEGIEAVNYKVIAKAGSQSDGEENVLPVLSNRTLVTETLPLNIRGNATKNYSFTKLLQSGSSSTLKNYHLTLEFTSNPAWYAVQALPYLMEYPYQCSEQTFNRFYSNALASNIANSNPKIKQVFDQWRNMNSDALLSNLEKNQELKSLLLQETPWVLQSQDETERKKRIALLFDLNRMSNEMDAAVTRLQQLQTSNGGWSWFAGGPDNRYITQYIISGIGHLQHLNVATVKERTSSMLERAVPYLDDRMQEDYDNLLKYKVKLDQDNLSYYTAHFFYARSYFTGIPVAEKNKKAFDYFKSQMQKYWTKQGIYSQGMTALALHRFDDKKTPAAIIKSLKENSITNEELGMYWKNNSGGYYWYEAPIETQALLIEVFDEAANDQVSVDNMKLWLLKQKQTSDWRTTKATAEAVYALLLRGSTWLMNEPEITISLGKTVVDLSKQSSQAGTGYFKTSWKENDISAQMGNISVTRKSSDNGISWGAVYWQYFEQLDKITASATPLSLQKKLFLQGNSATGPVIEPITATTSLKPGDLVKVRIELRVDRDMEYVHMKDLRAACFEPLNVLSEYKWQDGLGYYEETKDASTNFFFDHLRKGTYVFEYPLRVQLKGDFSNGITSIQCMYAPEFTSHSEGVRVTVK
ncbi:MAG: alpha-2-macroglobulin family protein, partial [Chitinophagales bacterium]